VTPQLVDLARAHAPLLLLVLPLAGAAVAFALPFARASWIVAIAAMIPTAALALDLAARRLLSDAPVAAMGEGVALSADNAGVFAAALIAALGLVVSLGAGALIPEHERRAAPHAMALMLCVIAGWMGASLASDLAALFVASQLAWLSAVGVTALSAERDRGALNGAWRMLTAGGAASAFMLLGVGLIQRAFASMDLGAFAIAQTSPPIATAGAGLVLLALATMAAVAPLHLWSSAVFGRGGGLAAMCVGVLGVTGALATLVRVAAHVIHSPELAGGVTAALAALGVTSVIIGSAQAVGARDLRRIAGYACAAQAGGVLLCAALGSPAGFEAALIQLCGLSAAALALYAGAAAARAYEPIVLDGLGGRAPWASAAITAGALSLMGAPLTLGFLGRWRLVEAGVGAGWWWAAGAVIIASLAGVFYGGRLIERMYFRRAATVTVQTRDSWRIALWPALVLSMAAIAIGFWPSLLMRAASAAAATVTGDPT
jgi:formate hydrogenlyase subunit 3/multisubunit Na+/H+ antiporter MnhD subunit